jgi:hypothetical protein
MGYTATTQWSYKPSLLLYERKVTWYENLKKNRTQFAEVFILDKAKV